LFSGLAWGSTATAVFQLISLYQSAQLVDAWQKPTYWAIAIGTAIIGFIIWIGGKKESDNVETLRKEIVDDMQQIHSTFFPDEDLDADS